MNVDEHGSIESGPSGSGIFPMGFLLMIAGTTIFFTRLVMYVATRNHATHKYHTIPHRNPRLRDNDLWRDPPPPS